MFTDCAVCSEIQEEENVGAQQQRGGRRRESQQQRQSLSSVVSPEYEREILQRNRDTSVTFGYREGSSTQDLRRAAQEPAGQPVFSRDPAHRSSLRSTQSAT